MNAIPGYSYVLKSGVTAQVQSVALGKNFVGDGTGRYHVEMMVYYLTDECEPRFTAEPLSSWGELVTEVLGNV